MKRKVRNSASDILTPGCLLDFRVEVTSGQLIGSGERDLS